LQIKYSPDADALIIKLRDGMPVDSVDLSEGIIAHYSKDKKILEIEILDASKVVQMSELNVSLKDVPIPLLAYTPYCKSNKEMYETARGYILKNMGNQVSAGDVYYDNSTKTWNVKIISKTPHGILIVGEISLDDENTIVSVTPGAQVLNILRSKLREERVLIDVPADALAFIKETVSNVTVYG